MSDILNKEVKEFDSQTAKQAGEKLASLVNSDDNVGDLLSLNYNEATILVHDSLRQKVGGLPLGCFLLATRIINAPNIEANADQEDTAILLLRVIGGATLSNNANTEQYRLDASFRSVDSPNNWDSDEKTDQFTLNQLRHAGVRCSVLGTFRMKQIKDQWELSFGADISNFYSGRGMKVYKPIGHSLIKIVNYTKPTGEIHSLAGHPVEIGRVRYCSSEISINPERENVNIEMEPSDLIARRTALFGMSRSGKSNTVKIIASAIFNLRHKKEKGRIGQLIFDVNGEYCNDNPQDKGCLRNIGKNDVATYGIFPHPNDKTRNLLKINFLGQNVSKWENREQVSSAMATLIAGKEIIDEVLSQESAAYVKNFYNTSLDVPDNEWGYSDVTRYRRVVEIYRAFLVKAGFEPSEKNVNISGLFNKDLREKMKLEYAASAETLGKKYILWEEFYGAIFDLAKFIKSGNFKAFNEEYIKPKNPNEETKKPWADETLKGILSLLENTRGIRLIGDVQNQHNANVDADYSDKIVDDVRKGKLVIVDQSTGSPDLVKISTERIMWKLFGAQKQEFIEPKIERDSIIPPPEVIVYVEEAHNLLPAKSTPDELKSIWARVAKEGSKFHIGMVYSTQEPSSILSNILKNTDNWFVAHLNNTDEVRELKKYYDFEAFAHQIVKVPDTGFLRMRCLSNPYIVPVQVHEFIAPTGDEQGE